MYKLLTLAKNTFVETLRQPVYGVIIVVALLLFLLGPALTMYSLDDDDKFLREIDLSTLFLASLFISIFAASGAVAEEIANKTITTVMSKPVRRPIFILAKFLGVAGAVALAHYIFTIALLMSIRHGVLEAAWEETDWTVVTAAGATVALTILLSVFFNYVYEWKFSSTAVVLGAVLGTIAILFLAFIDRNWQFNPAQNRINLLDVYACILLLLGALVIAALAVALSARFNVVVTLIGCMGFFLLGLVTDYAFGRYAPTHLWAKICYFLVPNLQVFWVSDALYEGSQVPAKYILIGAIYGLCYTAGILALSVALFQRREVG